jgi:MOSC domain-containing protein YiiM
MGRLLGIARATAKRAPLQELDEAEVRVADGIVGDVRGTSRGRQVTVLFRKGWDDACDDLGVRLPWVTRRANLLIEGVPVPDVGERLTIGGLVLEVTQETKPCQVMEAAHRGLRRALGRDWRGGICCTVVTGSRIRVGDSVDIA